VAEPVVVRKQEQEQPPVQDIAQEQQSDPVQKLEVAREIEVAFGHLQPELEQNPEALTSEAFIERPVEKVVEQVVELLALRVAEQLDNCPFEHSAPAR